VIKFASYKTLQEHTCCKNQEHVYPQRDHCKRLQYFYELYLVQVLKLEDQIFCAVVLKNETHCKDLVIVDSVVETLLQNFCFANSFVFKSGRACFNPTKDCTWMVNIELDLLLSCDVIEIRRVQEHFLCENKGTATVAVENAVIRFFTDGEAHNFFDVLVQRLPKTVDRNFLVTSDDTV